jgi:hypothetical protein
MVRTRISTRWLLEPPITGAWAHLCAIALLAIPTLVRLSVDGIVSGSAFGPYVPFVVLSALLLGWRHAVVVTVAAAALADLMFLTPNRLLDGVSDLFGISLFLISSALIIGVIQAVRSIREDKSEPPQFEGEPDGIIFSLEGGQAWASWSGAAQPVRLGAEQEVAGMMEEFLAQLEVGRRLSRQCGISRASAEPARPEWSAVGRKPG